MSKYLKFFGTTSAYEAYINGGGVILPNVSFCEDARDVHYNPWMPPHDYSQDYFTMVVTSGGDVTWTGIEDNALSYSTDNGTTWSTPSQGITLQVNDGDEILWKGITTPINDDDEEVYGIGTFDGDTNVSYSVEGNAMSLLFGDGFKGQTSLVGKDAAFAYLFKNSTNVTSAENLSLPATTLTEYCYYFMFTDCTSLTTAPELPATTLADSCYSGMFNGCTSLTTAPELPATTLADYCYFSMFSNTNVLPNCTNIDFSSQSVVASGGLKGLFYGTKITDVQLDAILKEHGINNYSLPATTLASYCYSGMFRGCTSLTTAPELPATTLKSMCYYGMFNGCTNLTTAPELPATTLVSGCYQGMFEGCTSLTTAPELPATTLAYGCYYQMFYNCGNLSSIKCLATNISTTNCTTNWVKGVAASGTFTKAASMTSWTESTSGVPSGWTVQDA